MALTEAEFLRLREASKTLRRGIIAPLTVSGYGYDWAMFVKWCDEVGLSPLPASSDTLCLYLTDLLEHGAKVTTARRRKCSIVYEHRTRGLPSPMSIEVAELLSGAQRLRAEKPRQMRPLTVQQLRAMSIDLAAVGTDAAMRNRAILVVGFASALRRSNVAMLNIEDVEFCAEGLVLAIHREKNDPQSKGRLIAIRTGEHASTCPVNVLRAWLQRRGYTTPGPLFWRLDRLHQTQRLDGECLLRIVKKCVKRIGLDPDDFGAHSLRSGLVTAAGEANIGVLRIGAYTNQSPAMVRRYFRRKEMWDGNPSGLIGL